MGAILARWVGDVRVDSAQIRRSVGDCSADAGRIGTPRDLEANLGEINIKMPRTMHYPDDAPSWRESQWSCSIIIDDSILYTSDTRFDEELLLTFDERYDFDVIFHDCQLFTGGVHASINELSTLPGTIREKIVLMHYGDNWRDFEKQARDAGFHSWAKQGHIYTLRTRAAASMA